jgi:hypothetical protein
MPLILWKRQIPLLKRFWSISVLLLLLLIVAAAGGVLWLATQPIDISRFAPRIAAKMESIAPGTKVTLGSVTVRRAALRGVIEVQVENSRLQHPKLSQPVRVGSLRVDLALLPLLRGKVQVRSVRVSDVQMAATVSLATLLQSDDATGSRALPWAPDLKSVQLSNVRLKVQERDSGSDFDVQLPTLSAYQNLFGGDVRLAGQVLVSGKQGAIPLIMKATATPDGPWRGDVRADLHGGVGLVQVLWPKMALPQALPPMTLNAALHQAKKLDADITLEVAKGGLDWPRYYARPLSIQRITAQAKWHEGDDILQLTSAFLKLDTLSLHGAAKLNLAHISKSSGTARFDVLSPIALVKLWPARLAGNGRSWIAANIRAGEIRDGRLNVQPGGKLVFDFKMHDLLATYRTPMPPLMNANGTGHLTEKGLTLDMTQGRINGLNVVPARVVIEDWSIFPNMMLVDMQMTGELPKLLTVLDSKPLGFISRYGVVPETARGFADGHVSLRFPLINALRTEEIEIQASAKTRSAMVPDIYAGRALNQADLLFAIDSQGMTATGKALVGPQPITLRWTEDFTGTKAAPSRYEIKAQSSVATLALLDIDMTGLASGPLDAEVDLDMKGPKMLRGQFRADARNAVFDMPLFGRIKAAGVPATVSGSMMQQGQQLIIDALSVASAPVTLRAEARLPLAQGRSYFDIGQFNYGRNNFSGAVSFGNGGPVSVQIYGGTLDAKPFLRRFGATASAPVTPSTIRTEINAKLDTVEMLGNINFKGLQAQATVTGDVLTRLFATGKLPGGSDARAELASNGTARVLTLHTNDAGQMGRALDLFKTGQGGVFDLVADMQGSNRDLTMSGHGRVHNMRVTDTPVMARLLTLASLTGMRDLATGRGILFETMDVPFKMQHGLIEIKGARAIGPGLGLTLEGQLQQSLNAIALRGVIIPSYTLNAAIGKIPLLGSVLTGGKGQGLIGFNYRITGSAAAPKVDVQTSSGLALGPLRRLFQSKEPKLNSD